MKTLAQFALFSAFFVSTTVAAAEPRKEIVHGKPSFVFDNGETRVAVTETGGQMIAWFAGGEAGKPAIAPYHVTPWQQEGKKIEPPLLDVLRGDFFCLPFGGNAEPYQGEQHPPHGETANGVWTLLPSADSGDSKTLRLEIATKVRPGKVTKELKLVAGHPVIYSRHTIEGFAGPTPLGHHATLSLPEKEGALRVSTSPFRIGLTNPTRFSDPAKEEYQSLAIDAKFGDLAKVPQIFKDAADADCTSFPLRRGYADLLCVVNEASREGQPAWVAAVNNESGYLWFALKDPSVLPSLLFWIENRGRHGAPWSGRNNCLGLEDLCTSFADGIAPSTSENPLRKRGVKTAIDIPAGGKPLEIRYIQGAVPVSAGFEKVERVEFSAGRVVFHGAGGRRAEAACDYDFLNAAAR